MVLLARFATLGIPVGLYGSGAYLGEESATTLRLFSSTL
jgi:hypothetical protein